MKIRLHNTTIDDVKYEYICYEAQIYFTIPIPKNSDESRIHKTFELKANAEIRIPFVTTARICGLQITKAILKVEFNAISIFQHANTTESGMEKYV